MHKGNLKFTSSFVFKDLEKSVVSTDYLMIVKDAAERHRIYVAKR